MLSLVYIEVNGVKCEEKTGSLGYNGEFSVQYYPRKLPKNQITYKRTYLYFNPCLSICQGIIKNKLDVFTNNLYNLIMVIGSRFLENH